MPPQFSSPRRRRPLHPRLLASCLLAAAPAAAQAGEPRERQTFISVTAARYVETYLRDVPRNLLTAQLDFENAYFVSVGLNQVMVRDFSILGVRRNSLEIEGQLVKHFGGQDHIEVTAAAALRSGEVGLIRRSSLNGALAIGLSYATRNPDFEYGPAYRGPAGGVRGLDARQLQFYLGFEAELSPSRGSGFHLLARLHHRSGGYGLISPQRTGSNYLGLGVRFDLGSRRRPGR